MYFFLLNLCYLQPMILQKKVKQLSVFLSRQRNAVKYSFELDWHIDLQCFSQLKKYLRMNLQNISQMKNNNIKTAFFKMFKKFKNQKVQSQVLQSTNYYNIQSVLNRKKQIFSIIISSTRRIGLHWKLLLFRYFIKLPIKCQLL